MHLFQLKYICQVSQGYYVEVSQIGSENVEAFSCGNFSAAKDPVLGGGLQCFVSVVIAISTPSTRGKHHQIKTHSTGNHKILQISWIWSKIWICHEHQWIDEWNGRGESRRKWRQSHQQQLLYSGHFSFLCWWWHERPLLMMTAPDGCLRVCLFSNHPTWRHHRAITIWPTSWNDNAPQWSNFCLNDDVRVATLQTPIWITMLLSEMYSSAMALKWRPLYLLVSFRSVHKQPCYKIAWLKKRPCQTYFFTPNLFWVIRFLLANGLEFCT